MTNPLFFDMLHTGRELEKRSISRIMRRMFLLGMKQLYLLREDDIIAGENIRDYWLHQASGADK